MNDNQSVHYSGPEEAYRVFVDSVSGNAVGVVSEPTLFVIGSSRLQELLADVCKCSTGHDVCMKLVISSCHH